MSFDLPFAESLCSLVTHLSCVEGDDLSTWLLHSLCGTQGSALLLFSLSGGSQVFFFFLFPLQLSGHTASCFGSVTTLLFCQIAHPYHFGFSFGVCTFPPAASTYSCHVSSFITTWFWGYDDPEGHFVQLQLILQMSWALWEKDRGLRQAVLLSSGAVSEILPGSFTWSQGSYGTSQSVSFYSGWALSPSQVD